MDIIDRINLLLSQRGITGAEMSRSIGLSTAVYSQWNTRSTKPSKKNVKKVADYFGVSVDYLLTGESEQKENPATQIGSGDETTQALYAFIQGATPEERQELINIANYIKSKRKDGDRS